jgi:LmbE family N-acetylglucosaminyl deacetylase/uncharacterized protein (DUF302 family)
VLCFTHGEASTLSSRQGDPASIRATELRVAAQVLGIDRVQLLDYPDGRLEQTAIREFAAQVTRLIDEVKPSHLLAFDDGGVTGHRDHQQATRAALAAAVDAGIPVLGWTIPQPVAERLNARYGTLFRGRTEQEVTARLSVSRTRQRRAVAAHASQSHHNPVLQHRLRLLGDTEHLRLLYTPPYEGATPMSYGYTTRMPEPFTPALVQRVRDALKAQGFGVLTEIDVRATMAAKLGVEMEDYLILGACNPPLAHRALDVDRQIGLLLPCNVVVRADGPDATWVEALDSQVMVEVTGRSELKPVADDAATRLRAALDGLST